MALAVAPDVRVLLHKADDEGARASILEVMHSMKQKPAQHAITDLQPSQPSEATEPVEDEAAREARLRREAEVGLEVPARLCSR